MSESPVVLVDIMKIKDVVKDLLLDKESKISLASTVLTAEEGDAMSKIAASLIPRGLSFEGAKAAAALIGAGMNCMIEFLSVKKDS